jgi:hypothetical protein
MAPSADVGKIADRTNDPVSPHMPALRMRCIVTPHRAGLPSPLTILRDPSITAAMPCSRPERPSA